MNDATLLAEGAAVGTWRHPTVNGRGADWPRRVAVVGGLKFDEDASGAWLDALKRSYPRCTVVTGVSRGAERFIAERARELGFTVDTPLVPEWAEDGHSTAVGVSLILAGADVVVTVGSPNGTRAAIANGIHKRCDAWREGGRPLVNIAHVGKKIG